ncbi:hypothetical protein PR048_015164 [Dryococelus australis]|uniref:Uncharacterized protein n=1 Tax=Dryococelus australis TaxID=614101 RepID=A0ABQ9HG78_9NEOP|nr:hypothetical protein PR048_015164 [Dryococelus australis]
MVNGLFHRKTHARRCRIRRTLAVSVVRRGPALVHFTSNYLTRFNRLGQKHRRLPRKRGDASNDKHRPTLGLHLELIIATLDYVVAPSLPPPPPTANSQHNYLCDKGGNGAWRRSKRLACLPPTNANWVQSPASPRSDFRMWESCRTMSLIGEFSRGIPVSPPFHSGAANYSHRFTLIGSQDLAVLDSFQVAKFCVPELNYLSPLQLCPFVRTPTVDCPTSSETDLLTNSQRYKRTENLQRRRHRDTNPRPSDYKSASLPLIYGVKASIPYNSHFKIFWAALDTIVLRADVGEPKWMWFSAEMQGRGETGDPWASSGTIPTCENPEADPDRVTVGFSHVGIVPDDAVGRRVFSGSPVSPALSFRRCPYSPQSPSSALKTSMLRAAQISSLNHYANNSADEDYSKSHLVRTFSQRQGFRQQTTYGAYATQTGPATHLRYTSTCDSRPKRILCIFLHNAELRNYVATCAGLGWEGIVSRNRPRIRIEWFRETTKNRIPGRVTPECGNYAGRGRWSTGFQGDPHPPTNFIPKPEANRVRFPAGLPPDVCMWASCWTMALVGGFSRGSSNFDPARNNIFSELKYRNLKSMRHRYG